MYQRHQEESDTSLSICVWDVKQDQYSVMGTESVSECVAHCVYHSFHTPLILQNDFIFFLWSKLPP